MKKCVLQTSSTQTPRRHDRPFPGHSLQPRIISMGRRHSRCLFCGGTEKGRLRYTTFDLYAYARRAYMPGALSLAADLFGNKLSTRSFVKSWQKCTRKVRTFGESAGNFGADALILHEKCSARSDDETPRSNMDIQI